jgi:hypothetical protein
MHDPARNTRSTENIGRHRMIRKVGGSVTPAVRLVAEIDEIQVALAKEVVIDAAVQWAQGAKDGNRLEAALEKAVARYLEVRATQEASTNAR